MQKEWQYLEKVEARKFSQVRIQLHQAVQLIRAIGVAYIEARSDDSHQNMEWLTDINGLAGHPFGKEGQYRLAIDFAQFRLLFLNKTGTAIHSLDLDGLRRKEAVEWLKNHLNSYGFKAEKYQVDSEFVAAPDGPFTFADANYFAQMAAWYSDLNLLLRGFAADFDGASSVRCWPHHFDLATLVTFSGQQGKSVGVGLSPGDVYYREPYIYITPWPFPDIAKEKLPGLASGKYHNHEWNGIVLTASEITAEKKGQQEKLSIFIDEGFKVAEELISK